MNTVNFEILPRKFVKGDQAFELFSNKDGNIEIKTHIVEEMGYKYVKEGEKEYLYPIIKTDKNSFISENSFKTQDELSQNIIKEIRHARFF